MSEVAAIVLAAGSGLRFGGAKLLAGLRGKPLVRHVVEAALASAARPVLVVVGADEQRIAGALSGLEVRYVGNPAHAEGLSTSLRAGFAALPDEARAAMVLLGDMPLVRAGLIDALVAAWRAGRPEAVVPTHGGRRGNPVLLSRALEPDLRALSGDVGAGPLLRARPGVRELAVEEDAILLDADTPEALARLASLTS